MPRAKPAADRRGKQCSKPQRWIRQQYPEGEQPPTSCLPLAEVPDVFFGRKFTGKNVRGHPPLLVWNYLFFSSQRVGVSYISERCSKATRRAVSKTVQVRNFQCAKKIKFLTTVSPPSETRLSFIGSFLMVRRFPLPLDPTSFPCGASMLVLMKISAG